MIDCVAVAPKKQRGREGIACSTALEGISLTAL